MYKNNQLWNRYFPRSQRISYRYRETLRCPSIYIIDLNKFLLLFFLTITKQKYFSSSPKLLFNYIVFEFTLLLVVRPQYSENYIATIFFTLEWASSRVTRDYLITHKICPTQCAPNVFRILGSVDALNEKMGVNLTYHDVNWIYNRQHLKGQGCYLKTRVPKVRFISCLPDTNKGMDKDFLIL